MTETMALPFSFYLRGLIERITERAPEDRDTDAIFSYYNKMRDDPNLNPEVFRNVFPESAHCEPVVYLFFEALERNRDRDQSGRFQHHAKFVGHVFDDYTLKYRLGKGGLGEVYFADGQQHRRTPERLAIKVIPLVESSGIGRGDAHRTEQLRAKQEAEILERVGRDVGAQNLVHFYGAKENEQLSLVLIKLEFFDGQTLDALCSATLNPLPPAEAIALIIQACSGIGAMHKAGVLHRDIKPSNLMIDATGRVKVTDFGLAGVAGPTVAGRLTRAGQGPGGTPGYVAPEQALGGVTDARTDGYSLGWTLFDLVCPPSSASTEPNSVFRNLPDRLDPMWQSLPPGLMDVIIKATAKNPDDRYPDVATYCGALSNLRPANSLTECLQRFAEIRKGEDREVSIWVGEDLVRIRAGGKKTDSNRWTRRNMIVGGVFFAAAGALGVAAWSSRSNQPAAPPSSNQSLTIAGQPKTVADLTLLKGDLDIDIYEPGNPLRQGIGLDHLQALPLKSSDLYILKASVNQPVFVYILLIKPDGAVKPVFPWSRLGEWDSRPPDEEMLTPERPLTLQPPPNENGEPRGWPVPTGPAGMLTLLLLASDKPLPRDADLAEMLGKIPVQVEPHLRAKAWFENGNMVRDRPWRDPDFEPQRINDPVLEVQQRVKDQLIGDGKPFSYSLAVTFATEGRPLKN